MKRIWTEEEVRFLRDNYENMTYDEIGKKLGRSCYSINVKVRRLGLHKLEGKFRKGERRKLDLMNKRFGRLLVIREYGRDKNRYCLWLCRCDCGKEFVTNSQCLIRGSTKSCGCYHRERASECTKLDLTGKKFGRLTVISECGRAKSRSVEWLCKCDCGNEKIVPSPRLKWGDTKSCGCLHLELVSKRSKNNKYGYKHGLYGTRGYIKNQRAKYKAIKLNQTPIDADSEKIAYIYRVCEAMNQLEDEEYQVDHIKPLSRGGLHHQDNLQILEKTLNHKKHAKITDEYKGITLKDLEQNSEKYIKYLNVLKFWKGAGK